MRDVVMQIGNNNSVKVGSSEEVTIAAEGRLVQHSHVK